MEAARFDLRQKILKMEAANNLESSDEDEVEWEQVDLGAANELEIVLQTAPKKLSKQKIVELHKASLILLMAACLYRFKLICSEEVKGFGLSLGNKAEDLGKIVKNWSQDVSIKPQTEDYSLDLDLTSNQTRLLSPEESCLLFAAMMISKGYTIRLVCIIYPIALSKVLKQDLKFPIDYLVQILDEKHQEWITLDPIAGTIGMKQRDCLYVIGINSGGMANLTPLFAKQYSTRIPKRTLQQFFKQTVWLFSPSHMDSVTRREEMKMREVVRDEAMPTSLTGFLNHPMFVIKKQLKRNEFLSDDSKIVGYFKKEAVYKRGDVVEVYSKDYWKRQGRFIGSDVRALKTVKGKRKRREEFANDEDLYSESQTCPWPITLLEDDEPIPCNSYGNLEIYHPDQIPGGCVLLDLDLLAQAKFLKNDFVKACTGFEHSRKGTFPVYSGIIVKHKDVDRIVDLKCEHLKAEEEKERELREIRVYTRWKKLIVGAIGRDRLFRQYL